MQSSEQAHVAQGVIYMIVIHSSTVLSGDSLLPA